MSLWLDSRCVKFAQSSLASRLADTTRVHRAPKKQKWLDTRNNVSRIRLDEQMCERECIPAHHKCRFRGWNAIFRSLVAVIYSRDNQAFREFRAAYFRHAITNHCYDDPSWQIQERVDPCERKRDVRWVVIGESRDQLRAGALSRPHRSSWLPTVNDRTREKRARLKKKRGRDKYLRSTNLSRSWLRSSTAVIIDGPTRNNPSLRSQKYRTILSTNYYRVVFLDNYRISAFLTFPRIFFFVVTFVNMSRFQKHKRGKRSLIAYIPIISRRVFLVTC